MSRKATEFAVNMLVEHVGKVVSLDNERYELKEELSECKGQVNLYASDLSWVVASRETAGAFAAPAFLRRTKSARDLMNRIHSLQTRIPSILETQKLMIQEAVWLMEQPLVKPVLDGYEEGRVFRFRANCFAKTLYAQH